MCKSKEKKNKIIEKNVNIVSISENLLKFGTETLARKLQPNVSSEFVSLNGGMNLQAQQVSIYS